MRLIMVRHGQTVENIRGIIQGQLPGRLTREGKMQAKRVGERLKDERIDICLSSDLRRAADTAKEIMKQHPDARIKFTRRLRELNFGELQGKTRDEAGWEIAKVKFNRGWTPKGAESVREFGQRAKRFWQRLRRSRKYKDKTILLVSHGGFIKRFLGFVLGKSRDEAMEVKTGNASVTIIEIKKGKKIVHSFNCTKHLCYKE